MRRVLCANETQPARAAPPASFASSRARQSHPRKSCLLGRAARRLLY